MLEGAADVTPGNADVDSVGLGPAAQRKAKGYDRGQTIQFVDVELPVQRQRQQAGRHAVDSEHGEIIP